MDVIGDSRLPRNYDVVTGRAGTRDAHLTDQEVMLADLNIVGDLDEIVDFGAVANAGRLESAAVDGGASAHLHVIADFDVAQLRHFDVLAAFEPIAEAVCSDHGVGVDGDAVAEDGAVVQDGIGKKRDIVAELAMAADDRARVDAAARSNDRTFANRGKREDAGVLSHDGCRMHKGPGIDAVGFFHGVAAIAHDGHEGVERVFYLDQRDAIETEILRHHRGRSVAILKARGVLAVNYKGDVAWSGLAQRSGTLNGDAAGRPGLCRAPIPRVP